MMIAPENCRKPPRCLPIEMTSPPAGWQNNASKMNNPEPLLTIVVPAWKLEFLDEALHSIAMQTDQRFAVTVFDDAGPAAIRSTVQAYPEFNYVRFEQNLGGVDLIGHWNRCLQMIDTPWVWMFSDDDVMTPDCVAGFYEALARAPEALLFQFSVKQVDEGLVPLCASAAPAHESISEFIAARFRSAKVSCVPDHVFHWETLRHLEQGFINFPLAWNSDDATWVALGQKKGIHGIATGEVLWRQSGQNISASMGHSFAKLRADVSYLNWLRTRGHLTSYLSAARWLSARISCAYGFRWSEYAGVFRLLPPWLKPAGVLALVYPAILASKRMFK
jgi:hypothetical protein